MVKTLKCDEVRKIDQIAIEHYGMTGLVLMENAGRGAAEAIDRKLRGQPSQWSFEHGTVTLLCGPGNNGGDGYVIARHLQLLGWTPQIVSLVPLDRLSGDAVANAAIADQAGIPIQVAHDTPGLRHLVDHPQVIVDCLLGTGATGAPRGLFCNAISIANSLTSYRVAIDLPSGLDCDSGVPSDVTFQADLTLTFVAYKQGFRSAVAREWLGEIEVIGIGVPRCLLESFGVSSAP